METKQISLTKENFKKIEKDILKKVTQTSKALIETFKFRLIYGTKFTKQENNQILKSLNKFRKKNWDKSIPKEEAYNKYINYI